MKKIIIVSTCFFLISASNLFAQKDRIEYLPNVDKKKLHFAYYLGLNKKGFKVTYNPSNSLVIDENSDYISVEESLGFNIGLVVGYNLNENISVRFEPGLSSNTKTLTYDEDVVGGLSSSNVREIPGTYLRLPLLMKLSTNRLDNMRAFVIGGVSYDYNFSSNENNVDDNTSGQFRMKTSNFMYEIGLGVDIYLQWFKFSPSIRGIFAINNELVNDDIPTSPFTGPVDFLGTRGIFINFTFQ